MTVSPVNLIAVPCLRDNYAYIVHRADQEDALVIDPGEAKPVQEELERRGLRLRGILNTHHHHDHVGGNLALQALGEIPVYANHSDHSRIPGAQLELVEDETYRVAGLEFTVFSVPGHTLGALVLDFGAMAFTGDTLFCAGCGRLFEGTPEQMLSSFRTMKRRLQPHVEVYTGHEYTEANLEFALSLNPQDEPVKNRLASVRARRAEGQNCAHSSVALELQTNPFFRVMEPEYRRAIGLGAISAADAFAEVRRRKDNY
ncbi:MAG: hydroxyacylglutathione hydrolase [Polyangiaceae bacterium]|nr:hydroxyacylglutathione hydrolase [Polyangiaceae bacterium]